MKPTVVVRSKDEADRLRLTLTSLARQTEPVEVIVVNDGSSDHTAAVLEEAAGWMAVTAIHHETPRGRSEASNAGARAASGDILIFLDGDTLAGPEMVARHAAMHAARERSIGRGEVFHLRCTRFLKDPETASPWPDHIDRVARIPVAERDGLRVTRAQIAEDFDAVARRAVVGVYPGAGPRELHERELEALKNDPDCSVLWVAATGSNLSVDRTAFLDVGGFPENVGFAGLVDHRELALRLCNAGWRMRLVEGACCYHMTHRSGWRDPLKDTAWEIEFYRLHPTRAVKLMSLFWASMTPNSALPAEARIGSLAALEAAAQGDNGVDYDAARASLGLPAL